MSEEKLTWQEIEGSLSRSREALPSELATVSEHLDQWSISVSVSEGQVETTLKRPVQTSLRPEALNALLSISDRFEVRDNPPDIPPDIVLAKEGPLSFEDISYLAEMEENLIRELGDQVNVPYP